MMDIYSKLLSEMSPRILGLWSCLGAVTCRT